MLDSRSLRCRIRIGNAEFGEDAGFEILHDFRLFVGFMVVSQQMQKPVQDEMGQMVVTGFVLLAGFAFNRLPRLHNVPQHQCSRTTAFLRGK